ncbi:MAG: DUF362 domain-containing protein [Eggerthellaceae bacterium]|nr:DUF362 domain-containing protein [Eggerthellaceae bacterium]
MKVSELNRRDFVVGGVALGLSSAVGLSLQGCAQAPTNNDTPPTNSGQNGSGTNTATPGQSPGTTPPASPDNVPKVYFTSDISPAGLVRAFDALQVQPKGKVAVKISTGEPGGNYFLQPSLISDLVNLVKGTIVECNTAYGVSRAQTANHYKAAENHGFTAIAQVDIMDGEGSLSLPVRVGQNLKENLVGAHFSNYDFFLVLSHFKGHAMGGYGGAIKNASIGIASSTGKSLIHSAGTRTTGLGGNTPQDSFLESMAEAASSVADKLGENLVYVNVMNNLSVDCDCFSNPAKPDMADIGILSSTDPVALDQACVDLVYAAPDGRSLVTRIESRNGLHTLEHAEAIGLGSRSYQLVRLP